MSLTMRATFVAALIALPLLLLRLWTGFEYPSWVRWLMIVLVFSIGSAALISPSRFTTRRPAWTRAAGGLLMTVAAINAYFQFMQISPE